MFITEIPNEDTNVLPIQFVTGYVADVIASRDHYLFKEMGNNDLYLNAIKATTHYSTEFKGNKILEQANSNVYVPLMRGMVDVPTRGDQVLLCKFGGLSYYLGPVNTANSPNWNPDLEVEADSSDEQSELLDFYGLNPGFIYDPFIGRMEKYPINVLDNLGIESDLVDSNFAADYPVGDIMLEGRRGNSIRIGQRGIFPYIVLSNRRLAGFNRETYKDESLIAITSGGGVDEEVQDVGRLSDWFYQDDLGREDYVDIHPDFNLVSNFEDNKRQISFEDEPIGQILISSNKITFNSNISDFTVSSMNNINLASGNNIKLYTNNSTIIESKNIYLGEESIKDDNGKSGGEPLVLGEQLRVMLRDIVQALVTLKTTANSPAMSGPPDPVTLKNLNTALGQLMTPETTPFLSLNHFMEKNQTTGPKE